MDSLYSGDNIEEMLTMIFGDCQGVLNVYFTADAGDKVKDIIKNANNSNNNDNNEEDEDDNDNNDDSNSKSDNIDINALKTLTDLDQSTWDKIADVLSKPENNADYLLRHFLSEFSQSKHNEQHEASDNNLSEPYINNEFYPHEVNNYMNKSPPLFKRDIPNVNDITHKKGMLISLWKTPPPPKRNSIHLGYNNNNDDNDKNDKRNTTNQKPQSCVFPLHFFLQSS
jgi:hypothetical protein